MIVTSSNHNSLPEQLALVGCANSLERALIGGSLPMAVPSLSQSSNLVANKSLGLPQSMDARILELLQLEASRKALLARRAPQPSQWLVNSLLTASQRPLQSSAVNLRLLQLQQEAKKSLNAQSTLPLGKLSRQKPEKTDLEASPIDRFLQSSSGKRQFVEDFNPLDVLCGRGGKSNHHPGNKRYRQVVSEMKASYRSIGSKSAKTDLSRAIVEHVYKYGGRFLKMEKGSSKYIILTPAEARKKTSQALREAKDVKWTV